MVSVEVRHEKHIELAGGSSGHDRAHGLDHTRDGIGTAVVNIHKVGKGYRIGNK